MKPRFMRVAPEIPVVDIDQSLSYYSDSLGFEIRMRMADGHYAVVERDDVALHLFDDGEKPVSPVAIHVFVTDLEQLHQDLEKRGAHIVQPVSHKPWGCRDFRIADPSGNTIKFSEPL